MPGQPRVRVASWAAMVCVLLTVPVVAVLGLLDSPAWLSALSCGACVGITTVLNLGERAMRRFDSASRRSSK